MGHHGHKRRDTHLHRICGLLATIIIQSSNSSLSSSSSSSSSSSYSCSSSRRVVCMATLAFAYSLFDVVSATKPKNRLAQRHRQFHTYGDTIFDLDAFSHPEKTHQLPCCHFFILICIANLTAKHSWQHRKS